VVETREVCAERRGQALLSSSMVLIPREMPLVWGSKTISDEELARLPMRGQCLEVFPAPPAEPCDDVIESSSCSVAPSRTSGPWGAVFALAALAVGLLRRQRFG
jgi:MYXO-CTERM domain-containing protein